MTFASHSCNSISEYNCIKHKRIYLVPAPLLFPLPALGWISAAELTSAGVGLVGGEAAGAATTALRPPVQRPLAREPLTRGPLSASASEACGKVPEVWSKPGVWLKARGLVENLLLSSSARPRSTSTARLAILVIVRM